ncbi:unnamed protein product, partial [Laminaria digitata]
GRTAYQGSRCGGLRRSREHVLSGVRELHHGPGAARVTRHGHTYIHSGSLRHRQRCYYQDRTRVPLVAVFCFGSYSVWVRSQVQTFDPSQCS